MPFLVKVLFKCIQFALATTPHLYQWKCFKMIYIEARREILNGMGKKICLSQLKVLLVTLCNKCGRE